MAKVSKRKLTIKQQKFAKHFAAKGNGTQAAKAAGYSKKTAYHSAYENLKKPEVKKAIHEALEESLAKAQLKSDHVVEQLRRVAFGDLAEAYREDGTLKHPLEMSEETKATVQAIEISEIMAGGMIKIGEKKKLKLADRVKALELLGKKFGIFKEVVENSHTGNIVTGTQEEIDAAIERARKKT